VWAEDKEVLDMFVFKYPTFYGLLENGQIELLHFTDRKCYNNYNHCMKVCIGFKSNKASMESSLNTIEQVLKFCRFLCKESAKYKMSEKTKSQIEKLRKIA